MRDGFEVLFDGTMSRRGERMLKALLAKAPVGTLPKKAYSGKVKTIVMYGAGLDCRVKALAKHKAAGGRAVIWDLGYWDRDDAMRLSIDTLHPTANQLAMAPATGNRGELVLREDADPNGPVLLVGLGVKSCALYGLKPMEWESAALRRIQQQFPGRAVLWRPKGKEVTPLPGTKLHHGMTIEEALRGCSLVICRHSNVAVDACVAGVPVETQDGAALALYRDNPAPSRTDRAEFLRRLGWWNWRPNEARQAWAWIQEVLSRG